MPKNCYAPLLALVIAVFTHFSRQSKLAQEVSREQQRRGRIDKPLDTNPLLEDLSKGATFRFEIAGELPLFTFKIVPNLPDGDEPSSGLPTVLEIQVFRGESEKSQQSLAGCDFDGMETPPRYADWFRTDDVNFDGYQDIYLLTNWGATGNQYGCVWLYNSETGYFEYSKEFSELSRYWLDPANKTIFTFDRGGMAGMVFVAKKYLVENNRPVLIWSAQQDWDFSKEQFHCVEQERRNGEMVTTHDVMKDTGEQPPCYIPLSWFQRKNEKKE